MIYLYAIVEATAAVPACPGLDDASLRLVRSSEVAGLYSAHEQLELRPQPAALWRHEQVVEAAMQTGPTLPVRFGTTFADDDALRSALERDAAPLQRQLGRVQGCVELAVRVGVVDGRLSEPDAQDARSYLETKLARRRQQQAIMRETLAPLSELSVRAHSEESGSDRELICASYLVRGEEVNRFAERVRRVADQNPELWLSCTGPWPPYSFARVEEAA